MSGRYVTLAEVKHSLLLEEKRRELLASQRAALDHARTVCALSLESADSIVKEVKQFDDISDLAAIKIADITPKYPEDVRSIFFKERINLDNKKID